MTALADYEFETLLITSHSEYVYHVALNRPKKRNAMNPDFWREMYECFTRIANDENCRSIVISGNGDGFSAGLDLVESDFGMDSNDIGRKAFYVRKMVKGYQDAFTAIEKCPKPVVCAIHGFCIGGAVDLASACDIRYCSSDAFFSIKEVDVGLQADVGTLQRLPRVVGNGSALRELAFSGRRFNSDEAEKIGMIGRVFPDRQALMIAAFELAKLIASKSPVAVQGTKININYSRDHTVDEGLEFAANWNMVMLQSEDLIKCAMAGLQKSKDPIQFSKL